MPPKNEEINVGSMGEGWVEGHIFRGRDVEEGLGDFGEGKLVNILTFEL